MTKQQLRELIPQNKNDLVRAKHLVSLPYAEWKPVAKEILRRTKDSDSSVAELFIDYFSRGEDEFVEDVEAVLKSSKATYLAYVIVSRILPKWPADALERIEFELQERVSDTSFPEVALTSIRLLAENNLGDSNYLRQWLIHIEDRMERNLIDAREIKKRHFRKNA